MASEEQPLVVVNECQVEEYEYNHDGRPEATLYLMLHAGSRSCSFNGNAYNGSWSKDGGILRLRFHWNAEPGHEKTHCLQMINGKYMSLIPSKPVEMRFVRMWVPDQDGRLSWLDGSDLDQIRMAD